MGNLKQYTIKGNPDMPIIEAATKTEALFKYVLMGYVVSIRDIVTVEQKTKHTIRKQSAHKNH